MKYAFRFLQYLYSEKQGVVDHNQDPSKAVVESRWAEGMPSFLLPCLQNSSQYLCESCNYMGYLLGYMNTVKTESTYRTQGEVKYISEVVYY